MHGHVAMVLFSATLAVAGPVGGAISLSLLHRFPYP
jgi:hypothetical protein